MQTPLFHAWRLLVARGLLALFFGCVTFLFPGMMAATFALAFGAYALVDGVVTVAAGTRQHGHEQAWLLELEGMLGVAVGLAAIFWAGDPAPAAYVIAGWAISTGVLELLAALRLRREVPGELLFGLAAIASLALGVVLLAAPRGALALLTMLGAYALLFGCAMLLLGLRLRHVDRGEWRHKPA